MAILCPECGGVLRCCKTSPDERFQAVSRHRRCESCGVWFLTEETVKRKLRKRKRRVANLGQY